MRTTHHTQRHPWRNATSNRATLDRRSYREAGPGSEWPIRRSDLPSDVFFSLSFFLARFGAACTQHLTFSGCWAAAAPALAAAARPLSGRPARRRWPVRSGALRLPCACFAAPDAAAHLRSNIIQAPRALVLVVHWRYLCNRCMYITHAARSATAASWRAYETTCNTEDGARRVFQRFGGAGNLAKTRGRADTRSEEPNSDRGV